MFINELNLYVEYLKKDISKNLNTLSEKKLKQFQSFKTNLLSGINYYRELIPSIKNESEQFLNKMKEELKAIEISLQQLNIPKVF